MKSSRSSHVHTRGASVARKTVDFPWYVPVSMIPQAGLVDDVPDCGLQDFIIVQRHDGLPHAKRFAQVSLQESNDAISEKN
jgi:hypothetical protein